MSALQKKNHFAWWCFKDDGAFSTEGMAVAILLSCALVFSTTWIARSQSQASTVQAVADAAALAAENEIAEFMIEVRVADATLLSLSLFSITLLAAGSIMSCVPAASEFGLQLINISEKVIEKRKSLAEGFEKALNASQKALPALAQAQAQSVILQNSHEGQHMIGAVYLVPQSGESIQVGSNDLLNDALDKTKEDIDDISEESKKVEEAYKKAHEAYEEAWKWDCGNNPSACMYERASTLASLPSEQNPLYHSPDTWSFSVALNRARSYYDVRLSQELPLDASIEEQTRSALRKVMYAYAIEQLRDARATEQPNSVPDIYFPLLPKNTSEMKQTHLYTDAIFYVSSGEKPYIHAYDGCPHLVSDGLQGKGSFADLDAGVLKECPTCHFSSSDLGKVMAASSSIDNGFEYAYRKVAQYADDYTKAMQDAVPLESEVKGLVEEIFSSIGTALSQVFSERIKAYPPGRFGSIAGVHAQIDAKEMPFIQTPSSAGSFVAVSAAGIAQDDAENLFSNLLDGIASQVDAGVFDSFTVVSGAWGALLQAYLDGTEGISGALEHVLNGIPLVSEANLGTWASKKFDEFLSNAGLEPVDTVTPKPVLVNTHHVLEYADNEVLGAIRALQEAG